MKFVFSFIVFFVLIITNKFFLFNEEFLILLSFISFCFLVYEKLTSLIELRFFEKSKFIQLQFLTSLNSISEKLLEKQKITLQFIQLPFTFRALKKYYLILSFNFLNKILLYLNRKEKNNFLLNLIRFNHLEKEFLKFITLLILKKSFIINSIIKFYGINLTIKRFQTINLINKLNLLKKI
uniref:ATP synthase F1 subunit 4 n=1 Tax=Melanothamnus gigas TaxID=3016206 RepID=A0A9F1U5D5_9FLOR|nr:ATP synthase F1 subunit 4 [Melanothamnus gigas]WAX04161.1 ATP synthase F1 subunit 4 [Melanothamnus gigas]